EDREELVEVADRGGEDHGARDLRGRLPLDVDRLEVLVEPDLVPGLQLAPGEDSVLLEEGRVLLPRQVLQRLQDAGEVQEAAALRLLLPLVAVAVPVEDDPAVRRDLPGE